MPSKILLLALGVPGGRLMMPNKSIQGQVLFGDDVWSMTENEYDQWNTVRQTPCDVTTADPLVRSLTEDGAFYRKRQIDSTSH